jgi:pimeloyl-ACP methyl ester carboxylesterase
VGALGSGDDRWVEADGCRLSVRVWDGERVPLVLLHGAYSTLEEWSDLAPQLAADGHAVVLYDARGHGLSGDSSDFRFSAQTRDLGAVIAACDLTRPIVVGASMGAMVGLEFVTGHDDVAGLVSLDGPVADLADRIAVGQPPPDDDATDARFAAAHFDGTAAEFETMLPAMIAAAPMFGEAFRRRQHRIVGGRAVRRPLPHEAAQLSRYVHEQLSTKLLREVRCPPLLLLASRPEPDDERGRARMRARSTVVSRIDNPAVDVEWLPTGHAMSVEAPELIVERIRGFIDRIVRD